MITRRQEVSRLATSRGDGVGFTLADCVDVKAVEAGRENTGGGCLDSHGGVPAREVDGGIGHVFAVGCIQLCGQFLSTGR